MRTVLAKDLKRGDTVFYRDEEQWTAKAKAKPRPGHPTDYGLSLEVKKPDGTELRISVGAEEPFSVG